MSAPRKTFTITWRIPNYASEHHGKTLCSHICQHRSQLTFQLVASPVASQYFAIYIICSNASSMSGDQVATVDWIITLNNGSFRGLRKQVSGRTQFSAHCENTFEQNGCFNFLPLHDFEDQVSNYVNDRGELVVTCEMVISTNFHGIEEPAPVILSLEKDDCVAVCAEEGGFWLAKLQAPFVTGKVRKVPVTWYDETPPGSGMYQLTQFTDIVAAESIHPVRLELTGVKGSKRRFQIKKTREYHVFLERLRHHQQMLKQQQQQSA